METLEAPLKRMAKPDAAAEQEDADYAAWATEVGEVVGYKVLAKTINGDKSNKDTLTTLAKLDIVPLASSSVQEYKKQMIRNDTPWVRRHWLAIIVMFVLVEAVASLIICDYQSYGGFFFVGGAFLSFIFVYGMASVETMHRPGEWGFTPMENYDKAVPEFALETALTVKKNIPTAKFWIEEYTDRNLVKQLDPFLFVWIGGQYYYLEVWNEPKFKGKRA